ncbi:hyoscyamine 6-dioxygenase-like [Lycium ferocissimum]|uniref:hyoscyamine 6-dioxygenase-like n=1 Tax=Lycium ferocissimum TaxID=112874 RepID=UPI0028159000|nr:hyoscyamine 6-dioxygenase-like [Lycium ferocissimum]
MSTPLTLSSPNHLPQNFVVPLKKRPEKEVPLGKDIPIIDIGQPEDFLVEQISKACRDFGLFQVVNHGVPENLMAEAMKVLKEFFALPAEEKAMFYDEDGKPNVLVPNYSQKAKLYTDGNKTSEGEFNFWRDSLAHGCHPLDEELVNSWPDKPATYKEVIGEYAVEVRNLAKKVLDIICRGLGLPLGYFIKELIQNQLMFSNYYPPCPEPSSALGVAGHYDSNIITLVQQDLYALQFLNKDGQWIGVEPISNAFIVILGLTFNVITNNVMEGAVHRVVTNQTHDRLSIVTFFTPANSTTIVPAKQLLSEKQPPLYRPYTYLEYLGNYLGDDSDYDAALKPYKI